MKRTLSICSFIFVALLTISQVQLCAQGTRVRVSGSAKETAKETSTEKPKEASKAGTRTEKSDSAAMKNKVEYLTQPGDDTLYVFEPAKSLLTPSLLGSASAIMYGPSICISGSGYGMGAFYQVDLSESTSLFADLIVSGARNTAEFEVQDGYYLYVPNKVNRVFTIPLILGANQVLFSESMTQNMRPFVSAGVGVNWVLAGPYDPYTNDFFRSMASARSFVRAGGFIGCGALIRNTEKTYLSFNVRYYVLPFGGDGIESIRNVPMKDFNGLFLSLSVGFR